MKIERNKQIDGLRGIGSLMIVIFHLFCRYQQIYCKNSINLIENWGVYGVCLFMTISGYFIFSLKENTQYSLSLFLKKRIYRLYPTYIFCLFCTTIVLVILDLPNNNVTLKNFILNAFWINGFIGTPYIEGAHWYITTLISIIFICGILKEFHVENNPLTYFFLLVLNAACYYLNIPYITTVLGSGYLGIAICGIAINKLNKQIKYSDKSYKKLIWSALIIVSILFTWKLRGTSALIGLLVGIPLIWGAILKKFTFLENKTIQYLGNISFELYLIHQNIGFAIIYRLQNIDSKFSYIFPVIALSIVLLLSILIFESKRKLKKSVSTL